jgi:hypothetical protein
VDAFVDGELRHEPRLVRVGAPNIEDGRLTVALDHAEPEAFKELSLCYTTNSGPWQKRTWFKAPASLQSHKLSAELPSARPLVAYLAVKDQQDRHISSEHVELPAR